MSGQQAMASLLYPVEPTAEAHTLQASFVRSGCVTIVLNALSMSAGPEVQGAEVLLLLLLL